jgi:hypothetical protein
VVVELGRLSDPATRSTYLLPSPCRGGVFIFPGVTAKGELGATSLGFSCLGFFASRLPRFCALAMVLVLFSRCGISRQLSFSVGPAQEASD